MSKARKAGLVLISILFLTGLSAAQDSDTPDKGINISQEDQVIWLNEGADDKTVNFAVQCGSGSVDESSVEIWDGVNSFENPQKVGENTFTFDVSERTSGNPQVDVDSYDVLASCNIDGETERLDPKTFDVDKLSVDIVNSTDKEVYIGEDLSVDIKLSSELGNMNLDKIAGSGSPNPPSLSLTSSKIDKNGNEDYYIQMGDNPSIARTMSIRSSSPVSERFISEEDDLVSGKVKVEAVYNEKRSESGKDYKIKIKDELQVQISRWHYSSEVSPSKRVSEDELKDVNMTVLMRYEGQPVTPPGDDVSYAGHFYLDRSSDEDLGEYDWFSGGFVETVEQNGKTYGKYELNLEKRPEFDIGTEPLDVMFETDDTGSKQIGEIIVRKQFTFEGRVSDSDSRAIETAFRLQSDEYIEEFETNSRGFFSRRVMPDSYGMDVEFPKGSLSLRSVELGQDYSGNINYQYYKSPGDVEGVDLQGIDPINMMTVSFGYPFDSGTASMEYNPAKTEDPMNVDLYECQRWNFWGEECISGWDRVSEEDVTLPPTSWNAEFPVTPVETEEYGDEKQVLYSAYVIGTNSGLALDRIGLESYRVPEGESFEVRGRAVTKGQPVENADVSIELLDGSTTVKTASTTTDSEGTFSTAIDAPESGNYSVRAEISKGSYDAYTDTIDQQVEVYRQKSLEVELPESFEVAPGETVDKTVTLTNDGQMAFEDASIEVVETDLDVSFSDEQFTLEPGDEIDIAASASVPEGFCDPSCVKYPTADIGINDGDFSEEYDLGVEIVDASSSSQTSSQQEEEQTNDGGSSSPLPDTPAGMVPANPANFALGLITVFSLALAAAVRKKKDSTSDRDSRTVNLQRPKVEPSEESDEEIDDVAGNMSDGDVDAIAQAMDDGSKDGSEDEEDIDELAEAMAEEEQEEETELQEHMDESSDNSGEQQDLSCDICGEEFDTESGLKLHRKAFH